IPPGPGRRRADPTPEPADRPAQPGERPMDRSPGTVGHLRKSGTSRSSSSSKTPPGRRVGATSNTRPAEPFVPFDPAPFLAADSGDAAWSALSVAALLGAALPVAALSGATLSLDVTSGSTASSVAAASPRFAVSAGLPVSSLALTTAGAAGEAGSLFSTTLPATADFDAASSAANHGMVCSLALAGLGLAAPAAAAELRDA